MGGRKIAYAKLIRSLHYLTYETSIGFGDSNQDKILQQSVDKRHTCLRVAKRAASQNELDSAAACFLLAAFNSFNLFFVVDQIEQDGESTTFERNQLLLASFQDLASMTKPPRGDVGIDWESIFLMLVPHLAAYAVTSGWSNEEELSVINNLKRLAIITDQMIPPNLIPEGEFLDGCSIARLSAVFGNPEIAEERCLEILPLLDEWFDLQWVITISVIRQYCAERHNDELSAAQLRRERSQLIDTHRENFRSRAGRMWGMQALSEKVGKAIVAHSLPDVFTQEVIFTLAEALKARGLLDDMTQDYCECPNSIREKITHLEEEVLRIGTPDLDAYDYSAEQKFLGWDRQGIDEANWEELRSQILLASPMISNLLPEEYSGHFNDLNDEFSNSDSLDELERHYHDYSAGYSGVTQAADWSEIVDTIPSDYLLIEYFMPENASAPGTEIHCFVFTSDGMQSQIVLSSHISALNYWNENEELLGGGQLIEMIAELRVLILQHNDEAACDLLSDFHSWLLQPILEMGFHPRDFKRWLIVPHGALHMVPFGALVDEDGSHLIEQVEVVMTPSASVWRVMHERECPPFSSFLCVANPSNDKVKLPNLIHAEREAADVQQAMTSIEGVMLTRKKATHTRVLTELHGRSVIHFASHGDFPLKEAFNQHKILLAYDPTAQDECWITAADLRNVDFSCARIVVLNICNGGVFRFGPGDELHGLVRSFIANGARNVLGTSWGVHDEMSRHFMKQFYNRILEKGPGGAMRCACQYFIHQQMPLAFWSGYTLMGDGR